ncbi:MAG: PAS domain S-box protein, partial [Deltaproteobacteria bacterium]|nr:PAS domain S-box protein [Deltaproteobacteria bacterium]
SALIHELEVHQLELELQNRELHDSHRLLEESRSRYVDLYDFAPVGYLTLDHRGDIQEINLTAATLLETERTQLIKRSLSRWVHPDDRRVFSVHLQRCMSEAERAVCELRLSVTRDGRPVHAQLHSIPMVDFDTGVNVFRTALIDLTERKRVEEAEATSKLLKEERVLRIR